MERWKDEFVFVSIYMEKRSVSNSVTMTYKDFNAYFNGIKWNAKYKWKQYEPQLKNSCAVQDKTPNNTSI